MTTVRPPRLNMESRISLIEQRLNQLEQENIEWNLKRRRMKDPIGSNEVIPEATSEQTSS